MKKILLIAVVTCIAILSCANCVFSVSAVADYTTSDEYVFVKDFCARFPNRKAGQNEQAAAYLEALFVQVMLSLPNGVSSASIETFTVSNVDMYNVQAEIDVGSDKQVIIGAHYDSSSGEGAGDNACGVASLYFAMKAIAANYRKLPCNVVFVAFDGEESGLLGSANYVDSMSAQEKENTLVMFNIDSVAVGDNLYLWCENKTTDLANLIVSVTDGLQEKPYAAGTYYQINAYGYYYTEVPQNSDNTPFRLQGIPTALFFSGTYDAEIWNYSESVDPSKQVMNTSYDTFENLDKNCGEQFVNRIRTVSNSIADTLFDSAFQSVGENAVEQILNLSALYNVWWPKLVAFGILLILAVVAFLYYSRLVKKSADGVAEIKTAKVFTPPQAEDIFTFKN